MQKAGLPLSGKSSFAIPFFSKCCGVLNKISTKSPSEGTFQHKSLWKRGCCSTFVLQQPRADEARLAEIAVLRGHILNYVKTREIYQGYKASGFSKVYFESHRQDLTLHKAAKEAFNERNLKKLPRIRDLNAEYAQLLERKKKNYAEYRQQKAQMQDWLMAQKIVSVMLDDKEQEQTEIHQQEERKAPEHS